MRKVFRALELFLPLGVSVAVWLKYDDVAATIASGYVVFLWIGLRRGWPDGRWLHIDRLQNAVATRESASLKLVHTCSNNGGGSRALEEWEFKIQELAEFMSLRSYFETLFQLSETRSVLADTRSTMLKSAFVSSFAALLAIGSAAVFASAAAAQKTGAGTPSQADHLLRLFTSIMAGAVNPVGQLMLICGSCWFVQKRNDVVAPAP